ncbi:MAG TPA: hypothetical protein GX700_14320 [Paracoccus sp.]|nr:hypothetical protein [Paracoccus sp. (in: a-proteobacteria)]
MRARLKGYRTFIFNGVMAALALAVELIPVILPVMGLPEVQAVVPEDCRPWWVMIVAVGNMWLRAITDTPPGRPE